MRQTALLILAAAAAGAGLVALSRETSRPIPAAQPEPFSAIIEPAPPESLAFEQRMRKKKLLARRIIAERIPLLEAAELFRDANGEAGMSTLVHGILGRSVREKLCRQVISFVDSAEVDMEAAGQGPPGRPVSAAMQAELDRRIAAGEFPPEPGLSE